MLLMFEIRRNSTNIIRTSTYLWVGSGHGCHCVGATSSEGRRSGRLKRKSAQEIECETHSL